MSFFEEFGIDAPVLGSHEPGTGPDWHSAEGPGSPLSPRTIVIRAWDRIPKRDSPTDRETLRWMIDSTPEVGTGPWANRLNEIDRLVKRARAGYRDGSLPELGHFRPVYFDGMGNK